LQTFLNFYSHIVLDAMQKNELRQIERTTTVLSDNKREKIGEILVLGAEGSGKTLLLRRMKGFRDSLVA